MEEKRKQDILELIGFIFLGIYIYVFILFLSVRDYTGLLWVCYVSIPIMAFAILFKKPYLLWSQVLILLIPDIIWGIDFFYRLVTNNSLIGLENFFFTNPLLSRKFLSLQHLIVPWLALFALYLVKPKKNKKVLFISFSEILLMFIISYFLLPNRSINCLPNVNSCLFSHLLPFIPYPIFWIIIEFSFILVSYFITCKFLTKKTKNNH